MIKKFGSDVSVNVIAPVFASLIFLVACFFWGRYQERQHYGKIWTSTIFIRSMSIAITT